MTGVTVWGFGMGDFAMMALILVGGVLAILLYEIIYWKTRSEKVNRLLETGNVEQFILEEKRDIERIRSPKMRDFLVVNLTAGLCYAGRFEEAENALRGLNPDNLHPLGRILYFNNLLNILLHSGKIEAAKSLFAEKEDLFRCKSGNSGLDEALKSTRAHFDLQIGDLVHCHELLDDLLRLAKPPIYQGSRLYLAGLLAIKEGNQSAARELLEHSAKLTQGTFIPGRIEKLLAEMDNPSRNS